MTRYDLIDEIERVNPEYFSQMRNLIAGIQNQEM